MYKQIDNKLHNIVVCIKTISFSRNALMKITYLAKKCNPHVTSD